MIMRDKNVLQPEFEDTEKIVWYHTQPKKVTLLDA